MDETINIRVDNAEVLAKFKTLLSRVQNPTPALKVVGYQMATGIQRNFDRQSGPDGAAWSPLAAATLAGRRNKSRGGTRILIDSGRLRGSMTSKVETPRRVVAGTKVIYGPIQDLGGSAGRGHRSLIPARPFMGLRSDDLNAIVNILERYLVSHEGIGNG